MGVDVVTLGIAKKYTKETVEGAGAVAGKPCQIQSIEEITGGHRVTFLWVDNSSVSHTSTMDVMDGVDGQDGSKGDTGLGIKGVAVSASNHLIVTYDDDTTEDAGEIEDVTTSFERITDVDLSNLTDGQILKYNATTGKWENASAGSVDTNLVDLNDVDVESLTDGQIIVWDATSGRWVNADNEGGSSTLSDLTDTAISSPTESQPLTYDPTNNVWVNGGIIPIANGGTGNSSGYIRAGARGAIGANATAEGSNTTASGLNSHAEGYWTQSTGTNSHAEGDNSIASNGTAHAQNYHTTASGNNSSAAGSYTTAGYQNQFVIGQYNDNKSANIFEIGIGANANARANGLELDSSGNLKVAGTITDGNGNELNKYLEQTVTLSTSASTTVTFTDSSITANSFIEYACNQWDLVPESITGAAGSCTIVLPKVDSAQSVTVRIYVR